MMMGIQSKSSLRTRLTTWTVEDFAKLKPEPFDAATKQQLGLTAHHDDDDILDNGLNVHGWFKDDPEGLLFGQYVSAALFVG